MYSYILVERVPYEGTWILGVVFSLEEANNYYDNKVKRYQEPQKMSDEDLIQRALTDNWEIDYIHHYVEVYNGLQKISIFKFNTKTRMLEEQEKSYNVNISTDT